MRWHHVRSSDGWEIRDEDALLVASLVNPAHDREDDARLLADAPRLRERLNRYEQDPPARKARLLKEMVEWESTGWFSSERAQRFDRSVRVLAKQLGRDHQGVLGEIRVEAKAIIARDEKGG